MSMVVTNAYKLKKGITLWDFVSYVQEKASIEITNTIKDLYLKWLANEEMKSTIKNVLELPEDKEISLCECSSYLEHMYRKQITTSRRNFFDLDVYVTFRELNGDIYFITRSDMVLKEVFNFLKKDEKVEPYHYWDLSDEDKNCSKEEWNKRGEVWNELDKKWKSSLHLDICNIDNFYQIDPWLNMMSYSQSNQDDKINNKE